MSSEKKYRTGLVIGKFYPLHKGHQYLIDTALKACEKLFVIVTQTDGYKIPAYIRKAWIKKLYPKIIVQIFEHSPEFDLPSPEKSKNWAIATIKFLGFSPAAVFTSEDYGDAYAKYMNSEHIVVDKARSVVPISGTKIREDINKYWDFLDPVVQSYFKDK